MKKIFIIFQKELLDNLRDYRSWVTGLFWALFGPLILGGMIMLLGNTIRDNVEEPLRLPVSGAEHAPNLIAFLEQQDVIVETAPADPEAAVIAGDINVALMIPVDYGEDFSTGETANVQLVFDSTRQSASTDIDRAEDLLEGYSRYIGIMRLSLRGVSPEVLRVIQIEEVDTATPQSQALIFISMLPYFIIFAIFNGASAVIIDATAGERERGSLEPLLINPLPRSSVAIGKMISAIPFAIFNLVITLVGFAAIFQILPVEELIGIQIGLDVSTLVAVFLICLPIVLLACAIQNSHRFLLQDDKGSWNLSAFHWSDTFFARPGVSLFTSQARVVDDVDSNLRSTNIDQSIPAFRTNLGNEYSYLVRADSFIICHHYLYCC